MCKQSSVCDVQVVVTGPLSRGGALCTPPDIMSQTPSENFGKSQEEVQRETNWILKKGKKQTKNDQNRNQRGL